MTEGRLHRGAELPYKLLAGVESCPAGWLVVIGRLQGITLHATRPEILPKLIDILDYKPAFTVVALHAPVGLPSEPGTKGRTCDREARRLVGFPRSAAFPTPPCRAALSAETYDEARELNGGRLSPVVWGQFKRLREVNQEMQPYWQRTVYETNPELAFHFLNEGVPTVHSKHTPEGVKERRTVLEAKLPGADRVLSTRLRGASEAHIVDAVANLWCARRIASRAVHRAPEDPEWDDLGLRMEFIW